MANCQYFYIAILLVHRNVCVCFFILSIITTSINNHYYIEKCLYPLTAKYFEVHALTQQTNLRSVEKNDTTKGSPIKISAGWIGCYAHL